MKTTVILLVLLLQMSLFPSCVHGQVLGQANRVLKATERALSPLQTASKPPEPAALDPHWWTYFEVSDDLLEKHIQKSIASLKSSSSSLSLSEKAIANPLIDQITFNLLALPQVTSLHPIPLSATASFATAYNLEELLIIGRNLKNATEENEIYKREASNVSLNVKGIQDSLANLTFTYRTLPDHSTEKFIAGLIIISERSSQALLTERLRLLKETLSLHRVQEDRLRIELQIAPERLQIDKSVLDDLTMRKQDLRRQLEMAKKTFIFAQAKKLATMTNPQKDEAEIFLQEQNETQAGLKEALIRVNLMCLELKENITELLIQDPPPNLQKLHLGAERYKILLKSINEKTHDWQTIAQRELNRLGETSLKEPDSLTSIDVTRLHTSQETLILLQQLRGDIDNGLLLSELLIKHVAYQQGPVTYGITRSIEAISGFYDDILSLLNKSLFAVGQTPVSIYSLTCLSIIIALTLLVSSLTRLGLKRLSIKTNEISPPLAYNVGRLAHYFILAIGIIIALASIGIDFTNFALFFGLLSVGLGFGLQSIFNNFISGIIILFERPLKVGDFIELESAIRGEVQEINVRSTRITTHDGIDILVPNSEFINGKVMNWTLHDNFRRLSIPFGVAHGSDKEIVKIAALEAAAGISHTNRFSETSEPFIRLTKFGESSLDFELVVWVDDYGARHYNTTMSKYLWALEDSLRKHKISLPFPQRDIHLRSGFNVLPPQ